MSQRGFTLMELLITVAIAAILLAVAAPSFTSIIRNNQMAAARDDVFRAIQYARSHAVSTNQTVTICSAQDPISSGCNATGGDFADGWIVFEGALLTDATVEENVLRVHESYENMSMIFNDAGTDKFISYLPSGLLALNDFSQEFISVCDVAANPLGTPRSVKVTQNTGQVRTGAESDADC